MCSTPRCRSAATSSPGWGREMGEFALENYLEVKAVTTALT